MLARKWQVLDYPSAQYKTKPHLVLCIFSDEIAPSNIKTTTQTYLHKIIKEKYYENA